MPESPKTVLMLHLNEQQVRIWDAALQSQGIQIDWRPTNVDVVEVLMEILTGGNPLPDLVIMDIGVKSPNSNSLQVVPVCNWCRGLDNPLKVLLFNSNSMQVKPYEQKWATAKCGAIAIVPKLSQATLESTTEIILEALDQHLDTEALDRVSMLIADIYTENLESEITRIRNAMTPVAEIVPKAPTVSSYRGSNLESPKVIAEDLDDMMADTRIQAPLEVIHEPDKLKLTTYRGVKVKKLGW
jgi:hypothetical protein